MSTRVASTPAVVRGVIAALVLVGLFAMHGLAHAGACADFDGSTSAVDHHHAAEATSAVAASDLLQIGPVLSVSLLHCAHGSECVATIPRSPVSAPILALVTFALMGVAALLGFAAVRRSSDWLRGPPVTGVRLLQLVCVSRT